MKVDKYYFFRGAYILLSTFLSFYLLLAVLKKMFGLPSGGIQIVLVPSYLIAVIIGMYANHKQYKNVRNMQNRDQYILTVFYNDIGLTACEISTVTVLVALFWGIASKIIEDVSANLLILFALLFGAILALILGIKLINKCKNLRKSMKKEGVLDEVFEV